jgi:DnaK suppressor protein
MPAKKSATKSSKAKKAATRKVATARKTAARKPAAKPKAKTKAKGRAPTKAKPKVTRTKSKAPARAKSKAPARGKAKAPVRAKARTPAKTKAKAKAKPATKPRAVAKAKVAATRTSAKPARPRKAGAARKPVAKVVAKPARKAPAAAPSPRRAEGKGPARPRAKATRAVAVPKQRRAEEAVAEDEEGYDAEGPHNLLLGPRNVKPYIERRGEAYMSTEQLDHFRLILTSWKRDLMEEVDRTMTHMKDEAANPPDPNDRATLESEFALELRTRDRERKLIRKIDEALKRIEDGSYGYCLETGDPIGVKRLEARPVATLCIEAQERRERREKQYGDRDDWYR